ncbi:DUF2141 domain-containing protein [Marinobacteraceae bacterium S3BR75-40.1]
MKTLLIFALLLVVTHHALAEELRVSVIGSEKAKGELFVALFDKEKHFPDGDPVVAQRGPWRGETVQVRFVNIPAGQYAIAAFVDTDDNDRLSKNFLGIPTEPYGFSGDAGFGPPDYSDVSFEKGAEDASIQIHLDH